MVSCRKVRRYEALHVACALSLVVFDTHRFTTSARVPLITIAHDINGDAMSGDDWRDPGAYEWTQSLDAFGFAWEFLRRNPEFVKELRFLTRIARRRSLTETEL
jgi:hypothetical protein